MSIFLHLGTCCRVTSQSAETELLRLLISVPPLKPGESLICIIEPGSGGRTMAGEEGVNLIARTSQLHPASGFQGGPPQYPQARKMTQRQGLE